MQKTTQQGNKRASNKSGSSSSTLSISIGQTSIPMSVGQVKKLTSGDWDHCHGIAGDGTQVNSLSINDAADSLLIRDRHGKLHAFDKKEFEVALPKIAKRLGIDLSAFAAQA